MRDFLEISKEHGFELATRDMIKNFILARVVETGEWQSGSLKSEERVAMIIRKHVHNLPRGHQRAGHEGERPVCVALRNPEKWGEKSSNKAHLPIGAGENRVAEGE